MVIVGEVGAQQVEHLPDVQQAAPARRGRPDGPAAQPSRSTIGALVAGEEDEPVLADLDLVAVLERGLLDAVAVDVGAVEAAGVLTVKPSPARLEHRVAARDGDVVEEDVAVGVASGGDLVGVEQEPAAGARALLHDQQRVPDGQRVHGRRVDGAQRRSEVSTRSVAVAGAELDGRRGTVGAGFGALSAATRRVPHCEQKRASSGFCRPQAVQNGISNSLVCGNESGPHSVRPCQINAGRAGAGVGSVVDWPRREVLRAVVDAAGSVGTTSNSQPAPYGSLLTSSGVSSRASLRPRPRRRPARRCH